MAESLGSNAIRPFCCSAFVASSGIRNVPGGWTKLTSGWPATGRTSTLEIRWSFLFGVFLSLLFQALSAALIKYYPFHDYPTVPKHARRCDLPAILRGTTPRRTLVQTADERDALHENAEMFRRNRVQLFSYSYRKYQRTAQTMIAGSKCRHLNKAGRSSLRARRGFAGASLNSGCLIIALFVSADHLLAHA